MATLTWLFFALSCIVSGFTSYSVTKWYYVRKIKKTTNKYKNDNTNPRV